MTPDAWRLPKGYGLLPHERNRRFILIIPFELGNSSRDDALFELLPNMMGTVRVMFFVLHELALHTFFKFTYGPRIHAGSLQSEVLRYSVQHVSLSL